MTARSRQSMGLFSHADKRTQHPWENRKALSEEYEGEMSNREGWWRKTIRETPLPGTYETDSFLDDFRKKQNTYRFKSNGRTIDPQPHGKGAVLLPGAYEQSGFIDSLNKKQATYNFKGQTRNAFGCHEIGTKDKDFNVSPQAYEVQQYMSVSVDRTPSKHHMFKSQSRRLPSKPFMPRLGPGPGNYEYTEPPAQHSISSSFKSRTPRFMSSHSRTPGPGSYEKAFQYPLPKTIEKIGRQHGLFFTSAFQA